MKKRIARRKSDLCILNVPWRQYLKKAQWLAENHVQSKAKGASPRDPEDDWSDSESSVRKDVSRFGSWLIRTVKGVFGANDSDHNDSGRKTPTEQASTNEEPSAPDPHPAAGQGIPPPS